MPFDLEASASVFWNQVTRPIEYSLEDLINNRTHADFDDRGEVTGSRPAWVPFEFDQTHVIHVTGGVVLPLGLHLRLAFQLRRVARRADAHAAAPGLLAAHHLDLPRGQGALLIRG